MPCAHNICRDGKTAIFRSRVHTAKPRGLCSNCIVVNGALPLAFPTTATRASGLTSRLNASRSKFDPRAILGTFRDIPHRIKRFRVRLQCKPEVVPTYNWWCRKVYLCTALGCNTTSLLALQQLTGQQQPVWRQNTGIHRISPTEHQDDVCCFVCSRGRKRVVTF
jgi:hypothetical protein